MAPLAEAEEALARFDERLRGSPLAEGFRARILFHEICAEQRLEGLLVYLEDLVLFAAGAFDGAMSPELSSAHEALQLWRRAAKAKASTLLLSPRPGEAGGSVEPTKGKPDFFFDPDWNEAERIKVWRSALDETRDLPPVLAAGIAWDAWLFAEPDQRGAWRAPLIAALVLKTRKKTLHFLLPLALGVPPSRYRDPKASFETRMLGFCGMVMGAVKRCERELNSLILAQNLLNAKVLGKQKNSRLALLIELLVANPVVALKMVQKELRVSHEGASKMMSSLGSVVREMSGRKRYRVWGIS